VDAFETGAIDYLLKPVSPERLAQTVQRLKSRLAASDASPDLAALGALFAKLRASPAPAGAATPLVWITASSGRDTRLILVEDVVYFRADHKYTVVMTAEGEAVAAPNRWKTCCRYSTPPTSSRSTAPPSSTCAPSLRSRATTPARACFV
jgi:DNA-binding LytR/AlgR family response regulator